jgi:hypothetical protein
MRKTHKSKHNKKRNTAFLYEVLIQDITKSVMSGDHKRKELAVNICKKYFGKNSVLYKERELYVALSEAHELAPSLIEKLLSEVKKAYAFLDKKEIFNTQTRMIAQVNRQLSPSVFGNFVSSYKTLATISQILNQEASIKKRLVLENNFLEASKKSTQASLSELEPTDSLVYKTFIKNYNIKYEKHLLPEQREVVTRYATSFSDNGVALKSYLNEELGRLKDALRESLDAKIIKEDKNMLAKTKEVLAMLESYKEEREFNEDVVAQILEIQSLVKEIEL